MRTEYEGIETAWQAKRIASDEWNKLSEFISNMETWHRRQTKSDRSGGLPLAIISGLIMFWVFSLGWCAPP